MGLFQEDSEVFDLAQGNLLIASVYQGTDLVWDRGAIIPPDIRSAENGQFVGYFNDGSSSPDIFNNTNLVVATGYDPNITELTLTVQDNNGNVIHTEVISSDTWDNFNPAHIQSLVLSIASPQTIILTDTGSTPNVELQNYNRNIFTGVLPTLDEFEVTIPSHNHNPGLDNLIVFTNYIGNNINFNVGVDWVTGHVDTVPENSNRQMVIARSTGGTLTFDTNFETGDLISARSFKTNGITTEYSSVTHITVT